MGIAGYGHCVEAGTIVSTHNWRVP